MKFIVATICCVLIVTCAESEPQRKIINGFDASEGQFPYQVSLQLEQNRFHFCGGSILNPTTILTACHCFYNKSQDIRESRRINMIIVVGSINKTEGTTYKVKSVKCHKQYNRKGYINDIALLEVETEIQFTRNVKPIKLPTSNIADNKILTASGWGMTSYKGTLKNPKNVKMPDILQFLKFSKMNSIECMERMGATKDMLCGMPIFISRPSGICSGDSGGPLVAHGIQYGIASWVGGSCASGKPDVFTNVFSYIDWIENEMFVDYYDID